MFLRFVVPNNQVMIQAGQYIDSTLGVSLGLATMVRHARSGCRSVAVTSLSELGHVLTHRLVGASRLPLLLGRLSRTYQVSSLVAH